MDVFRNLIPRAVHKQAQQKRLCTTKCLFFADVRATPSSESEGGAGGMRFHEYVPENGRVARSMPASPSFVPFAFR